MRSLFVLLIGVLLVSPGCVECSKKTNTAYNIQFDYMNPSAERYGNVMYLAHEGDRRYLDQESVTPGFEIYFNPNSDSCRFYFLSNSSFRMDSITYKYKRTLEFSDETCGFDMYFSDIKIIHSSFPDTCILTPFHIKVY